MIFDWNIEKNASKSDKLTAYCKEFLYIDNAERENAELCMGVFDIFSFL